MFQLVHLAIGKDEDTVLVTAKLDKAFMEKYHLTHDASSHSYLMIRAGEAVTNYEYVLMYACVAKYLLEHPHDDRALKFLLGDIRIDAIDEETLNNIYMQGETTCSST